MPLTKRRLARAAAALAVVAGALWFVCGGGGAGTWSVTLRASRVAVAPWQSVQLDAIVTPAAARGWVFTWTGAGGDGPSAVFRSGQAGEHHVRVLARSPDGVERTAAITLRVGTIAYVGSEAAPPATAPRPELGFEVADIEVEKETICRGEPTQIRITARRAGGDEGWLVPSVDGKVGWTVPYSRLAGAAGTYRVPIRLLDPEGGAGAYVDDSAYVEVKDCVAPWVVIVQARRFLVGGEERGVDLTATLRDGPTWEAFGLATHERDGARGAPVSPVATAASWRWELGDGDVVTTRTPFLRHELPDEEARGMDGLVDSYTVRAIALDADGRELGAGVVAVSLINRTAELKRTAHRLQLAARHAPVPATGAGGARYLDVTLRNIDGEETARLESMSMRTITCAEADGGVRAVGVESVFPERVIPPGGEITGRVTWPAKQAPDVCFVNVAVTGRTAPGDYEVVGYFSLEVGRSRTATTVTDPARVAALREVTRALGDPRVPITPEVIRRLENQGKIRRGLFP